MDFLYDGSFEGLMTAVYEAYYFSMPEGIYKEDVYELNILKDTRLIETDSDKAEKVSLAIVEKMNEDCFIEVLHAYLSEAYDLGCVVLDFLKFGFKIGGQVLDFEAHEAVNPLKKLARTVAREAHMYLGLTRFVKLKSGIYYAELEPKANVITILAPHFKDRMTDQLWVIHDKRRNYAVFYNKDNWYVNELDGHLDMSYAPDELEFQSLWKAYHKQIAIEERINPKLQMQMMPKRYWSYLIEM